MSTVELEPLIDALKAVDLPPDAPVLWSDGAARSGLASWRGSYSELTICEGGTQTLGELIADLEAAIGKTFEGYKGGDFTMSRHSLVYADPFGEYIGVCIVGGVVRDGAVVLTVAGGDDFAIEPAPASGRSEPNGADCVSDAAPLEEQEAPSDTKSSASTGENVEEQTPVSGGGEALATREGRLLAGLRMFAIRRRSELIGGVGAPELDALDEWLDAYARTDRLADRLSPGTEGQGGAGRKVANDPGFIVDLSAAIVRGPRPDSDMNCDLLAANLAKWLDEYWAAPVPPEGQVPEGRALDANGFCTTCDEKPGRFGSCACTDPSTGQVPEGGEGDMLAAVEADLARHKANEARWSEELAIAGRVHRDDQAMLDWVERFARSTAAVPEDASFQEAVVAAMTRPASPPVEGEARA